MIVKDKTYRTRDGYEVRIYATDGLGTECVHGAVRTEEGWSAYQWCENGQWILGQEQPNDLIECDPHGILPKHREAYVSAHEHVTGSELASDFIRNAAFESLDSRIRAALIALAKLDGSKS